MSALDAALAILAAVCAGGWFRAARSARSATEAVEHITASLERAVADGQEARRRAAADQVRP